MRIRDEYSGSQSRTIKAAEDVEHLQDAGRCDDQAAALTLIVTELRRLNEAIGRECYWKDSNAYKRVMEILDDYWEKDEKRVEVEMRFWKDNGETQEKRVVWVRPQKG